ncbi:hypothetical protein Haur_1337 [Herpetosiphon aurantiacus DSM 785]|uniref:Uncharacterized protein n=1 Tax=Herpetosiphon aurantiacus (strain ATCC 23779 / DSM 785 / 114-95) TaxID=316274 RepID=A9B2D7_HERA2|nr:hypothetical protein Haur_1337 [Herpetosiphon aurantiacus DSM 785]
MGKKLNLEPIACESFGEARDKAAHIARYSQYRYLVWERGDDQYYYALATPQTVKQMMLDAGTQGLMRIYDRTGFLRLTWWVANNIRRQLLRTWRG